jgi:predicted MFS family arabinose efflux permease
MLSPVENNRSCKKRAIGESDMRTSTGEKTKLKIGIYGIGFLMMGGLGISGSLAVIANNFPNVSQVMIQNLISIPSIMIIPTTLVVGKIMSVIAKKWIAAAGIILFIAAGLAPAFLRSFEMILAARGIFGIGLGICQVVANALVAENFSGAEKERTQGALLAVMMCGAAVMVFLSGVLSAIGWRLAFFVHLIAILPLLFVLLFLPVQRPLKESNGQRLGAKITPSCWVWVGAMFLTYVSAQAFPVFLSFLLEEKHLGTVADASFAMAFFAVGGILTGILFGGILGILKRYTLATGYLFLAVSNALIAFSPNIAACYAGSFMIGVANIIIASCIFIRAGLSVDIPAVGMAISLVSCAQNFGQFCSPFAIGLFVTNLGRSDVNFMAFLCAGGIAVILAALALKENLKKEI